MKMNRGVEAQLRAFLNSALDGSEWLASRPGHFTSGVVAPGAHLIGGWVGPRAAVEAVVPAGNGTPVVQPVV